MFQVIQNVFREISRANRNEKMAAICAAPDEMNALFRAVDTQVAGNDLYTRAVYLSRKGGRTDAPKVNGVWQYCDPSRRLNVFSYGSVALDGEAQNVCVLWDDKPVMVIGCIPFSGPYEKTLMVSGMAKPTPAWIDALVSQSDAAQQKHHVSMAHFDMRQRLNHTDTIYHVNSVAFEKTENYLGSAKMAVLRPAPRLFGKTASSELAS